ncbi:unnamed protein product [Penicillium palitans]
MSKIELIGFEGRPIRINTGLFINNEFQLATGGSQLEVENPTTGSVLASVSAAQRQDVDAAVSAAILALQGPWLTVTPTRRGQLLNRLADLIERDADDLASLEALDAGVLFGESKGLHIPQATETLRYFAGWADKIAGQLLSIPQGYAYTRRELLGVCAAVVPWNAPLMITIWKLAPAIAAGNALIIKTPELASLFPHGVLAILCGSSSVAGQALAEHGGVKNIAFTGSAPVGREILRAVAGSNLKKMTLELGGKRGIVFSDADLDNAIFWTRLGFTANNGQFLLAFAEKLAHTTPGDPLSGKTTKGPVISQRQREKITEYIRHAKESSIRLLAGGDEIPGKGNFVPNATFADVPDDARIIQEEIFGPVASIAKFNTEAEVIEEANATEFELSAAVFTNDVHRAQRVSEAMECGQVTVNCWGMLHANTPFGGVKQSGFGRDMGEEALEAWMSTKSVKYFTLPTSDEK